MLFSLLLSCLPVLVAVVTATPASDAFASVSRVLGEDKIVSDLLGGMELQVKQTNPERPAIEVVRAQWNVPWLIPVPGIDYNDPHNINRMVQWMHADGSTETHAWWEWVPDWEMQIADELMSVSPGDSVEVRVWVYSRVEGSVYFKNHNTGQEWSSMVYPKDANDEAYKICLGDGLGQFFVEWTVAPWLSRQTVPVFNNVTFEGVMAGVPPSTFIEIGSSPSDIPRWWNLSIGDTPVAISEQIDASSLRLYSPQGKTMTGPH
ncbi:hypothetical protein F4778DRAFT_785865 [Xylariomycetidae sp. FL2044]|nr:hypothetical protein F4778DRAFT_785865 [Xylariomycetidae sp. FL2044]